uniref:Uncharacterized protein n=2 Tax=Stomoxys calcitrans TaxID=35570 RepID=A0A1I8PEG1_STOCA
FANTSTTETATMATTDEHYDIYDQLAAAAASAYTTNIQQLPQPNKRLQKLKKLKIREIQSLALEGGDTGRGYCSCDEQWTGSTTSSSSSSPASTSPPKSPCNATSLLSMVAAPASASISSSATASNAQATMSPLPSQIQTSAPASPTTISTSASSLALLPHTISSEAYAKTSETGSGINEATTNGSGYSRTSKQHQNQPSTFTGSMAPTTSTSAGLLKHHQHHSLTTANDYGSKALQTAVDKINESNFVVLSSSLAAAPPLPSSSTLTGPGSIKTITLRRNPIGATTARLKQQHHVRFSDEKNFSD